MTRTLLGLLGLALILSGCGGSAAGEADGSGSGRGPGGGPDGRLVLVSGRDDHGLLAQQMVAVYGGPGGSGPVGEIADGTLARVHRVEGSWLEVSAAEGPAARGWVDDYFLRGTVRLVGPAPSCDVRVVGREVEAGTPVVVSDVRGTQALVTAEADPGLRGWVPRDHLQELPPQSGDCGEDPPGDRDGH